MTPDAWINRIVTIGLVLSVCICTTGVVVLASQGDAIPPTQTVAVGACTGSLVPLGGGRKPSGTTPPD